jgi:uncharacterized membrane protein YjfL (UPF0719 family)
MTDHIIQGLIQSVLFAVIGVVVFGGTFLAIVKMLPFSVRKEIEEDQNTSLGILLGSVILGLSIIIAAAIN